jgi:hypothetical protein
MFLAFVEDSTCAYALKPLSPLGAPMGWVFDLLKKPTPISLRPFDIFILVIFFITMSKGGKRGALVGPMKNALFVTLGTTVVWFLYGLLRGGEFRAASWQTYLIFGAILLAFTVANTFRTAGDFSILAKWLIAAASYRAFMCWLSYFTWARAKVGESGAFLTNHDDTILWVVSILILIVNAVDRRSAAITARNFALSLFFMGAIQFNSRRLAWVSLAMGLAVMYVLFPKGIAKQRINRALRLALPVVLIYVAVGWGRGERIFLPLRSLSSVTTKEDTSTLARNAENLGLILTGNSFGYFMGAGWGRPYIPVTLEYDISTAFELWPYVPHNSILGLLAFTGALGFAGFWIPFPTCVFFCARQARMAPDPKARSVAIIGAAQLAVCANQLYGDMGIFSMQAMYVIAVSYGIALRLPALYGVWGAPTQRLPTAPARTPSPARAA